MKNLIKIVITNLLITGACIAPHIQASPFQKIIPSAARIGFSMNNVLAYTKGVKIKEMAKKTYDIDCAYSVAVKKGLQKKEDSYAVAYTTLSNTGQVISPHHIAFDAQFIKRMTANGNTAIIAATLAHEMAHLDFEHKRKRIEGIRRFRDAYAKITTDDLKQKNTVEEKKESAEVYKQVFEKYLDKEDKRISRLHEEEADRAIKNADLAYAQNHYFSSASKIGDDITRLLILDPDLNKETLALYVEACQQKPGAYLALEKLINNTHPLNLRRAHLLLAVAKNNPTQGIFMHYFTWAKEWFRLQQIFYRAKNYKKEG